MHDEIEEFLEYLKTAHGRAERTLERYGDVCAKAAMFVAQAKGHAQVTAADFDRATVERFIRHGQGIGASASPSTQKVRRAALSGLFVRLISNGKATQDPTAGLPLPLVKSVSPGYLEPAEFRKLCEIVGCTATDQCAARDAAIFTLAVFTGLRVTEIAGLTIGQVSLESARLYGVVRKGGARVDFDLVEPAVASLRRWLVDRATRYQPPAACAGLFVSNQRRPMSVRAIQHAFRKYVQRSSITGRRITFHSLRHTFGTALAAEVGVDVAQRLLGHKNPATTAIYTAVNDPRKRAALDRIAAVLATPAGTLPITSPNENPATLTPFGGHGTVGTLTPNSGSATS